MLRKFALSGFGFLLLELAGSGISYAKEVTPSLKEQVVTVSNCTLVHLPNDRTKAIPCQMTRSQIQAREREILDKDWRLVRSALPLLKAAEALRVWDPKILNGKHEAVCEVLRQDILQGRYSVFRTPEIATSTDGFQAYADESIRAEKACSDQDARLRRLQPDLATHLQSNMSSGWFQPLSDGNAELRFLFAKNQFWFYSEHEFCRQGQRLPFWHRKGEYETVDAWGEPIVNRTEVLGMAVLQRNPVELIAVEYIETSGLADPYLKSAYGGVLQPEPKWVKVEPQPIKSIPLSGKNGFDNTSAKVSRLSRTGGDSTFFITAFISPPPWGRLEPEFAREWEPSDPVRMEPCVWKLNN